MTLEELGGLLRSEREKRGVSVDDAAAHLKISARIIRALEEGDGGALPHAVYVRGFVRSYGTWLGLSGEELSAAMDGLIAPEDEDTTPQPVYTPVEEKNGGMSKLTYMLGLLLCLAGLGAFWMYRDADLFSGDVQRGDVPVTARPAPSVSPGAAPASSAPAVTAATQGSTLPAASPAVPPAPATPSASQNRTPMAAVSQPDQQLPGQQAQTGQTPGRAPTPVPLAPAFQQAQAQAQAQAQGQTPPQQPAAPATPQEAGDQHKIIITALSECWIHSNADDTDTRQFSLRKGDTFALAFSKKLVLKLGNSGGVRIRYDGQDLPSPGREGQVRTLTFPPPPEE